MHPCMVLLDQAFEIARQEEHALALEDAEQVESLSAQRTDLLAKAWKQRQGMDEEVLKARLQDMQAMHKKITSSAEYLHESIRSLLSSRRKQNGYFTGPKARSAQASKAFYLSRTS